MSRASSKVVLAVGLAVALTGCETMETMSDQDRTKAEGAGVGALVGAAVGYAVSGDAKGAAIGAAIGGAAGFAVGNEVAKRKQQYANDEDFLEAEIARTEGLNDDAREYHRKTKEEIAQLDKEVEKLRASYKKGKASAKELNRKQKDLEQRIAKIDDKREALKKEYQINQEVLKEGSKGNDRYLAKLEKENAVLKEQIEKLRSDGEQLAQINERLSL